MPGTTTLGLPTYTTADSAEPLDAILTDISDAADAAIQARVPMSRIVRLRRAATQSISASTDTAVSFDTEDADTGGFITATSSTITVPASMGGLYRVDAIVRYNAITSGTVYAWVEVNASIVLDGPTFGQLGAGSGVQCTVNGLISVAAGDVIKLWTRQTSAGAVNSTARFHMHFVAP